jgi:nucleoside-diphosphate-sugar epimerase
MLRGERPEVFGDGGQSRDFTSVANAVDACIRAATSGPDAAGEAMNVGCDDRITMLDLIGELNRILGTSLEPVFVEQRPGDVRHSQAAIAKATRLIGYRPPVDLSEGLGRTAAWYSEQARRVPARAGDPR